MSCSKENPYSVAALTGEIKRLLEGSFTKIFVEGEISGWRVYPSGHAYFTLKDAEAQIGCVMFASSLARCNARDGLKDGAKVLVYANCTAYAPRGNYQLVVLAAKLAGQGDLMQKYLELKAKLEREGLFDPAKKRPLPFLPRRIGIVTSEAGAVIHDMCTVMTRRFPAVEIRLYPSLVQGETAPATLLAGLRYFNATEWNPDLVILARGGGSFEDLFCFNDEALVRQVAAMKAPIISAVGHETDFTLCDFAADRRAGTPSIAAEIAVPVLTELRERLAKSDTRLTGALRERGEFFAQRLDHLADGLGTALAHALSLTERRLERTQTGLASSLALAVARAGERLAGISPRLRPSVDFAVERASSRLDKARGALDLLSPFKVLERGYSLVTDAEGRVLTDAASAAPGEAVSIRLGRGALDAEVTGVRP